MTVEVLAWLDVYSEGILIDGTLGSGGHSHALLSGTAPTVKLAGFDRDPSAIEFAVVSLKEFADRVTCTVANYCDISEYQGRAFHPPVHGILLDLGYSSRQMDSKGRGFSFSDELSLDMRYNLQEPIPTAADLVNTCSERELADIIWRYGEERLSRRIASAIVRRRQSAPFHSGTDLGKVISRAIPRRRNQKRHPATRTFQALRIAVNAELHNLEKFLETALDLLSPGGRLVIISFHSLEDRIVKQFMIRATGKCQCPPGFPVCQCNPIKRARILTRKPQVPSEEECAVNPRARSAKLRCLERIVSDED